MNKLPFKSASLNPLDFIDKNSFTALDQCKSLANALVMRTGEEKDPHFSDVAEECITALIALTVWYGEGDSRSLQRVDELATIPEMLEKAIELMGQPDERTGELPWDGLLARMGGRMRMQMGEEKASVLSTMARHLNFLRTPAIQAVTTRSSFDPGRLKKGKQTVYIVCPPEHMRAMAGWIRMVVGTLFKAVVRDGLGESRKVYAILDEAASLGGNFDALDDTVDKYRGYGLRTHFFYQSAGQLKKCWPKDQGATLLSNTTKVFFGTADYETAELESKMAGEATILVEDWSEGGNEGWNRGSSEGQGFSRSYGTSGGTSWNRSTKQIARKLIKAEEVLALDARTAITFGPGPPIATRLVRIFERPDLFKAPKDGFTMLWRSATFLANSVLVAACATVVLAWLGVAGVARVGVYVPSQRPAVTRPLEPTPLPVEPVPPIQQWFQQPPERLPGDVVRGE